jgi:hypothetical protein
MINQRKDFFGSELSVNNDSVPMLFVHVVSRPDGSESLAQFDGAFRIALCIKLQRASIHAYKKKNLAGDFENKRIVTERKFFRHLSLLLKAEIPDRFDIHLCQCAGNIEFPIITR